MRFAATISRITASSTSNFVSRPAAIVNGMTMNSDTSFVTSAASAPVTPSIIAVKLFV